MPKVPTPWTTNTSIGTVDPYDTSGTYNGGGTTAAIDLYDGVLAGQSPITTKVPAVWGIAGKNVTAWVANAAAQVGLRAYDSASTVYDSGSLVYDGNTQSQITTKLPAAWSIGSKNATAWAANTASQTGRRAYDSGSVVYDSGSLIYDGNTQSPITTKIATPWSTT